jgi:Tfp pilus assembly protein PilO
MSTQRTPVPDPATGDWHLDKRIPLALIFTLFVQTIGMVWYISGLVHRLDTAVDVNARQDIRLTAVEASSNAQAVANATMGTQITSIRESLVEMKSAQAETNRLLRSLSGVQP